MIDCQLERNLPYISEEGQQLLMERFRSEGTPLPPSPAELRRERRWADETAWMLLAQAKLVCYVPGCGSGYGLWRLLHNIPDAIFIVLAENDWDHILRIMCYYDYSEYLAKRRFVLLKEPSAPARILPTLSFLPIAATVADPMERDHHRVSAILNEIRDWTDCHRTHVFTHINNLATTNRNVAENLHDMLTHPPINTLKDCHKGRPALLVAAGPSIQGQLDHILEFRKKVVLISVPTMLKPLLARGIVPDFVTSLDYHPISAKFFEGLPPADLSRMIGVFEPKVNHAVTEAFLTNCGHNLRFLGNEFADMIEHRQLIHDHLPSGTTVAHLSFYLAQYLGCEPILLAGQDMAFSFDQYYPECVFDAHPWKCDRFKTFVKDTPNLRQYTSIQGKPIYSDEQMFTYLKQFEEAIASSKQRVIDCTAEGLPKRHCKRGDLAEILAGFAEDVPPPEDPFVYDAEKAQNQGLCLAEKFKLRERELRRYRRLIKAMLRLALQYPKRPQARDARLIKDLNLRGELLLTLKSKVNDTAALPENWNGPALLKRSWDDLAALVRSYGKKDDKLRMLRHNRQRNIIFTKNILRGIRSQITCLRRQRKKLEKCPPNQITT